MSPSFSAATDDAIALYVVEVDQLAEWMQGLSETEQSWAKAQGFSAAYGQVITFPSALGGVASAAVGAGTKADRARNRFLSGALPFALPEGVYALASALEGQAAETFALGWLLGSYRFTRYADGAQARAQLVAPAGVEAARVEAIAAGECLTRDLINTPTADMGPEHLEAAARELAPVRLGNS